MSSAEIKREPLPEVPPVDHIVSLRWSKMAPHTSGWYWRKDRSGDVDIVNVFPRPGHTYLAMYDDRWPSEKRAFFAVSRMECEWAGPIQEPQAI
jgi:hypothetical protein